MSEIKMRKLVISIQKEWRILYRDKEGLALLFLMPLILVFIITLLQESIYKNINETRIPIVLIDNDVDSVGFAFSRGVSENTFFDITLIRVADSEQFENAKNDVAKGKYQLGIIIPEGTTKAIRNRVIILVQQQVPTMMNVDTAKLNRSVKVELFFDPFTKNSFKNIIKSNLNEFISKIETQIIFITYKKIIDVITNQSSKIEYPSDPVITFDESFISEYIEKIAPNSVQHNVPAWTLFAMFFICIPLAGSIIKERDEGCLDRLKTLPISYLTILSGKIFVYLIVTLLQAIVIIAVGIWALPLLELPKLELGTNISGLFLITISAGLAATGYGILIGTIAKTHIQSSTFGSVSVVIFAALGGVWIPLYVMSPIMRKISYISPMNWGLQGYYEYFLKNSPVTAFCPYILLLIVFFVSCLLIAYFYKKYQKK